MGWMSLCPYGLAPARLLQEMLPSRPFKTQWRFNVFPSAKRKLGGGLWGFLCALFCFVLFSPKAFYSSAPPKSFAIVVRGGRSRYCGQGGECIGWCTEEYSFPTSDWARPMCSLFSGAANTFPRLCCTRCYRCLWWQCLPLLLAFCLTMGLICWQRYLFLSPHSCFMTWGKTSDEQLWVRATFEKPKQYLQSESKLPWSLRAMFQKNNKSKPTQRPVLERKGRLCFPALPRGETDGYSLSGGLLNVLALDMWMTWASWLFWII